MLVTNNKKQNQEIHFADGTSVLVGFGETYDLDESKCYASEIKRIAKRFQTKDKSEKNNSSYVKPKKADEPKKEKDFDFGGNV